MKILIIIGVISLIAFSVFIAKKRGMTAKFNSNSTFDKISTNPDNPIDFGYKTAWFAVKTNNKTEIAEILGLTNIQPANWESGIQSAYENGVFITPQIGVWTLAAGTKLQQGDNIENIEKIEKTLNILSSKFGEAHFFGTHRVVEYHNWMKSVNGKIERIYSYIGERGENIKVFGTPTNAESGLNLFNSLSKEAESETYWERDDLIYPDEELVMKIATSWSINPTMLTKRSDIKNELGLVGK